MDTAATRPRPTSRSPREPLVTLWRDEFLTRAGWAAVVAVLALWWVAVSVPLGAVLGDSEWVVPVGMVLGGTPALGAPWVPVAAAKLRRSQVRQQGETDGANSSASLLDEPRTVTSAASRPNTPARS